MNKNIPAVSIVIPMYNVEKYIGEGLDSILAQTCQDFEVIVVDDCSTDNSCAVVESYIPKFNQHRGGGENRLRLVHSKVNSGSGATPGNIGMRLSRGKYLFFLESDDLMIDNGLETLFKYAEEFQADVVHSDKHYVTDGVTIPKDGWNLRLATKGNFEEVSEVCIMSSDINERVDKFISFKMRWPPWTQLIRRDLLMENNLIFSNLSIAYDVIFTAQLLLAAKTFVLIPDIFYIQRARPTSNSRQSLSTPQIIQKKIGDVLLGIKSFEEIVNKLKPFANAEECKYKLFNFITSLESGYTSQLYKQIPAHLLDEPVRKRIDEIGNNTTLTTFLFSRMNLLTAQLNQQNAVIQQMQAYIQKQNQVIQQLQIQKK